MLAVIPIMLFLLVWALLVSGSNTDDHWEDPNV